MIKNVVFDAALVLWMATASTWLWLLKNARWRLSLSLLFALVALVALFFAIFDVGGRFLGLPTPNS